MRNNDFLYNLQSGFRRSHSTATALIHLIDQLLSDMDKDHVSGLVFVDYKKAFDLIDHGILLSKLEVYGVASKELLLLENYLNDRRISCYGRGAVRTRGNNTLRSPRDWSWDRHCLLFL